MKKINTLLNYRLIGIVLLLLGLTGSLFGNITQYNTIKEKKVVISRLKEESELFDMYFCNSVIGVVFAFKYDEMDSKERAVYQERIIWDLNNLINLSEHTSYKYYKDLSDIMFTLTKFFQNPEVQKNYIDNEMQVKLQDCLLEIRNALSMKDEQMLNEISYKINKLLNDYLVSRDVHLD